MRQLFLSALLFSMLGACLAVSAHSTVGRLPAPKVSSVSKLPAPKSTHTTRTVFLRYASIGLPYNYPSRYNVAMDKPLPTMQLLPQKKLSLRDAIMLALRSNPDVQSSEIQRIVDKYAVIIAKQEFRPQYTMSLNQTLARGLIPDYDFAPTAKVKTPVGTQIAIDYTNKLHRGIRGPGEASFTVTQPLLKGFGAVNTVAYLDALTTAAVARLTFKDSIITAVVSVITSYRTLEEDYENLAIQKATLASSLEGLNQFKLQVKYGRQAASDLLQQESSYLTTKLAFVTQQNSLQQDLQTFLKSLGLVPTASVTIQTGLNVKGYHIPDQADAIRRALKGNISYREDLLNLQNTRRAIITAQDARKWSFGITASTVAGTERNPRVVGAGGPAQGAGPKLALDLEIPIDNVTGKADLIDARVALEQAKLALEQKKEDLMRSVMTQLETLKSDQAQIKISKKNVEVEQLSLKAAKLKLKYGRTTAFEMTQIQDQLLVQRTALVTTKITYLNDFTNLYQFLGETLNKWNVKLKY